MNDTPEPAVYFHVGLGRTASTFLQYQVFPNFRGIKYIQRTRYRKAPRIIARARHTQYFHSFELDHRWFEEEIIKWARKMPETKIILILRQHEGYIASHYRRYIKNGYAWSFREFIDVINNSGFYKCEEISYIRFIQVIERHFSNKPLVLLYDELKKDPEGFIGKISGYMGANVDIDRLNLEPRHRSYSTKQLKAIFRVSQQINIRKKRKYRSLFLNHLRRFFINLIRYSVLFVARFIPDSRFDPSPLVTNAELEEVRRFYEDDWKGVLEYVGQ